MSATPATLPLPGWQEIGFAAPTAFTVPENVGPVLVPGGVEVRLQFPQGHRDR